MGVAAAVGLLLGWLGTSPAVSMGINWDAAAYGAEIASGRQGWSSTPWSSHYALGPIYVAAAAVARALGGTVLDGFRALGALALGVAAALIAGTARRLCGSRLLALLLTSAWLTSWGLLRLVCTWEDNVLFLPFAAAAIALAVARTDGWRAQDSAVAGLLVGAGSLVSWQAAVYLFPALYACAVLGGPGRSVGRRAGEAALILLAFAGARIGWALFYWATSDGLSLRGLLGTLFARPEPSYFPRGLQGWGELARAWRAALRHVAVGLGQVLGPWGRQGAPRGDTLVAVGAAVLLAAAGGSVLSYRFAHQRRIWTGHLLVATTTALLVAAALYVDLPVDKYKRYDFFPMLAVLLLSAVAAWRSRADGARHSPPPRSPVLPRISHRTTLALAGCLLVGQLALAAFAHARFRDDLATSRPAGYHGRGSETWFAFARRLRGLTPDACGYLFAFSELRHARYQLEIVAALWSELPGSAVLGAPEEAAAWRRPLPLAPLAQAGSTLRPCTWISPEARALLP